MDVIDYVIIALGLEGVIFFQLYNYTKLSNKVFKIDKFSKILFLLFMIGSLAFNGYLNFTFSRLIISFTLFFFLYYFFFDEELKDCFIRSVVCFIVLTIMEVLLSIIVVISPFNDLQAMNDNVIFKMIFSLINCLSAYLIISRRFIINLCNYFIKKTSSFYLILVILSVLLFSLFLLSHKYALTSYTYNLYAINIIFIICLLILFLLVLYNKYKIDLIKKEQDVLLNFMSNYEKLIDENRIKLHEVHNDLLVLKTLKNNEEEYKYLLDDLVIKYSKTGSSYKNIHVLPSGLKGILYYKLYQMKEDGIHVEVNFPYKPLKLLEKSGFVDSSLLKILSILFDNAYESSIKSKSKMVFIEVFGNTKETTITISNSYDKVPKLDKIYEKGYSTNKANGGYGLYILKSLVNKNTNIKIKQYLENDMFISELKIYHR